MHNVHFTHKNPRKTTRSGAVASTVAHLDGMYAVSSTTPPVTSIEENNFVSPLYDSGAGEQAAGLCLHCAREVRRRRRRTAVIFGATFAAGAAVWLCHASALTANCEIQSSRALKSNLE